MAQSKRFHAGTGVATPVRGTNAERSTSLLETIRKPRSIELALQLALTFVIQT